MAVVYCDEVSAGYCQIRKATIDSACHDLNKEAGKWIMYDVNGRTCYCICSCVGRGTEITLADGSQRPIENILKDQTHVLAAGLDLNFHSYPVGTLSAAAPGETKNTIYVRFTLAGKQRELVVTMDHPILVDRGGRKLVSAATLQPDDQLIDRNGNVVSIDDLQWGSYNGSFWELATSMSPPDQNYTGHLILTSGIVTGDFAISTFVDLPMGLASKKGPEPSFPFIGSKEWKQKYSARLSPADKPFQVNGATFTPAAAHRIQVPAHASSFLPSLQAALLEDKAPKVPISNQYFLEECEWLLYKVFAPLYPDINLLFDWYSDEVNSHSWVDTTNKKKYVYLSGGLARIEGFEYEGIALALAHEVGHLLGQPEVAPGLTCEGEADWYAASRIFRNLWFGLYYFEYTKEALSQLECLYRYLVDAGGSREQLGTAEGQVDKFGQPYPSNECRIKTIKAAMQGPEKPECADCKVPN